MIKWIAIIGVLMMFAANVIAALTGGFAWYSLALGGAGMLCFLSMLVSGEQGNTANYIRLILNVIFVFGTLVFLYLIAGNHDLRRDLTKNKMFSLSPQTIRYLRGMEEPIHVTGFSTTPREMQRFLEQFTAQTDKISASVKNPFADFREAQRLKNEFETDLSPGDIFIQSGKRKKKISQMNESAFINALVEVRRAQDTVIYFLDGHGEGSLDEPTQEQLRKNIPTFSALKRVCEERGMKVQPLEIMRSGFVPDDASAIVCAGPRIDLYPMELETLKAWLKGGGRLILMLDPAPKPELNYPNFKTLAAEFGILLKDDIILDPNKESMARFDMPIVPMVTTYVRHAITDNIPYTQYPLFVPLARTTNPAPNPPPDISIKPLLKSSSSSWSQPIGAILEGKMTKPAANEIGPQTLAVAASQTPPDGDEEKAARLVVFGDSDIFTDVNIVYQIPLYLFSNSINWLTQKADLVAVPPKIVEDTPMALTAGQRNFLALLFVVTIPSLIFFGGLGYSLIRRRMR
ncbi:MAG TPA: Gldg family protein [Candidatus Sumerlaeota bacterium]|nr:MAG: ABC-type uncharacterized transport system [candidate division BRC1 bacterium ADurb.Bin183]HOE62749.1 Gldg family protein [Candidatus Sumerlaeota bacterium]HRR29723.1 Gldg family protein [Candidatus Sumerlaeia bacterium]HON50391.1 Gldg family protein [Candidatus Sumerlaeota bacterium]HOR63607.1 Gldg family protein [Candidatus Sumerlaeota bacterium]